MQRPAFSHESADADALAFEELARTRADRELLAVVLRSGQRTPLTSAAAATLVAAVMSYDEATGQLRLASSTFNWWLSMLVLLSLNAAHATAAVRGEWVATRQRSVAWTYGLLGTLTAVAWGSSLWVFTPVRDGLRDNLLVTSMILVLCAGTLSQATHNLQVRLFAYPLAFTAAASFILRGGPAHMALAAGFPLMAFHLVSLTRHFQEYAFERTRLAMLNERLVNKATEEKQTAESLRLEADLAREVAVEAARAKSRFIAATSHDLRQPLHALVQYVADLRALPMAPDMANRVAKVDKAVGVMSDLMEAVLDFSRVSAGDLRPSLRAIAVPALLAVVESQSLPAARAKGLKLSVRPCTGYVLSDQALLLRVIGNIVQNAIRYTPTGQVWVRARSVPGGIRIVVADTGIGIARPWRQRVFDEYVQVNNPERDRSKGQGLGLAIARDLAALLGLRLRLRSREGRGTFFSIDVPEAQSPPCDQDGFAVRERDFVNGALVLLIDDDPMARDALASTLHRFGCRVLAAASGEEASKLLAGSEFVPQVVVSDLWLADGVDGAQLASELAEQQVRALGASFRPSMVIVTGDTEPRNLGGASGEGPLVLKKPVAPRTLYATLNQMLMQSARRDDREEDSDR